MNGEHVDREAWRQRLGPWGIWTFELDRVPHDDEARFAVAVEASGFTALWIAEGTASKEALTHAGLLLGSTERLIVGTGIANIHARDSTAMASGARTLAEAFPGRFVLGMGVSHREALTRRGHDYGRPLTQMRAYLEEMDQAVLSCPEPSPPGLRIIAALRPRMLELAATAADGVHTYFVPAEHTARARAILGPSPLLVPEMAVVLEPDVTAARTIARIYTSHYLARENYRNNLETLGFGENDLAGSGSDRLVDAVVAWGDADEVARRVHAHHDAGADHVVLQVLRAGGGATTEDLTLLSAALGLAAAGSR